MARAALVRATLVFLLPVAFAVFPGPSGVLCGLVALTQPGRRRLPGTLGTVTLAICLLLSAILAGRDAELVAIASLALPVIALLWLIGTRLERIDVLPAVGGFFFFLLLNLGVAIYEVHIAGQSRAAGLTIHANTLGSIVAVVLFIFLPGSGPPSVRRWRPLGLIVAGLLLAYSASRGAIVGSLAGGLGALAFGSRTLYRRAWSTRQRRVGILLLLVLLLSGAYLLASTALAPLLARLQAIESVADPLGRPQLWSVALELIAHRPFLGYGPNAWAEFAPRVEPLIRPSVVSHAHSQYLELVMWAGLAGLSCAAWTGVSILARLWKGARVSAGWAAAGTASITAIAIVSIFDSAGSRLDVLLIWALVVGLALVMTERQDDLANYPGSSTDRAPTGGRVGE